MTDLKDYEAVVRLRVSNYGLNEEMVKKVLQNGFPQELFHDGYVIGIEDVKLEKMSEK